LGTLAFGALCSRSASVAAKAELASGLLLGMLAATAFDVGNGLPWRVSPIATNWATSAQYTQIGRQVGRLVHGAVLHAPGEIGELAYFCNCDIVDEFSDRGAYMVQLAAWAAQGNALRHAFVNLDYRYADRSQPAQVPTYLLLAVPNPAPGVPYWPVKTPWDITTPGPVRFIELVRASGR
jgi:hypothetical protein